MMGIYEICNLHDGKATAYVGGSVDIGERWKQHVRALHRGDHENQHLQRAWDKYGEGAFSFCVLEQVGDEKCLSGLEQHWLDLMLEMTDDLYNISVDARSPTAGRSLSEEHRRKIGEALGGNAHGARLYPAFVHQGTGAILMSGCNLNAMCERHNLDSSHMHAVKNGSRKSHKGWTLLKEE